MNLMIISDGERGCGGRDFVRGLRVVFRETWNAPSYWDGNLRTSLSVSGDSINRGCPSKMGICVNMCFYQFQKPENGPETPPSRSKFRDLFRHVFKFPTQVPIFEDTLCSIIASRSVWRLSFRIKIPKIIMHWKSWQWPRWSSWSRWSTSLTRRKYWGDSHTKLTLSLTFSVDFREVRHPFIVSLLWSHKDSHCLYMLFPFICGGELFSHLRHSGKFSVSAAQFYAAEIVSALEYLHSLSIIYRDLKPENLLIDKEHFVLILTSNFGP